MSEFLCLFWTRAVLGSHSFLSFLKKKINMVPLISAHAFFVCNWPLSVLSTHHWLFIDFRFRFFSPIEKCNLCRVERKVKERERDKEIELLTTVATKCGKKSKERGKRSSSMAKCTEIIITIERVYWYLDSGAARLNETIYFFVKEKCIFKWKGLNVRFL